MIYKIFIKNSLIFFSFMFLSTLFFGIYFHEKDYFYYKNCCQALQVKCKVLEILENKVVLTWNNINITTSINYDISVNCIYMKNRLYTNYCVCPYDNTIDKYYILSIIFLFSSPFFFLINIYFLKIFFDIQN